MGSEGQRHTTHRTPLQSTPPYACRARCSNPHVHRWRAWCCPNVCARAGVCVGALGVLGAGGRIGGCRPPLEPAASHHTHTHGMHSHAWRPRLFLRRARRLNSAAGGAACRGQHVRCDRAPLRGAARCCAHMARPSARALRPSSKCCHGASLHQRIRKQNASTATAPWRCACRFSFQQLPKHKGCRHRSLTLVKRACFLLLVRLPTSRSLACVVTCRRAPLAPALASSRHATGGHRTHRHARPQQPRKQPENTCTADNPAAVRLAGCAGIMGDHIVVSLAPTFLGQPHPASPPPPPVRSVSWCAPSCFNAFHLGNFAGRNACGSGGRRSFCGLNVIAVLARLARRFPPKRNRPIPRPARSLRLGNLLGGVPLASVRNVAGVHCSHPSPPFCRFALAQSQVL